MEDCGLWNAQVTWLGYAATSGLGRRPAAASAGPAGQRTARAAADDAAAAATWRAVAPIDFLVADRVVAPPEQLARGTCAVLF